ncbi:histidine kinase [Flavihumibacter rivuli]|uniref:sensor histidine kinase n=1 Tax=Flavihumibacter rivuli TaxID=2838156 RepID=UPI001BDDD1CE|nr:histidine kinase [Flavihumibacter rivuli]ULQ55900.1 histidine kinase [Flavihumibacter rivuli]
MKRIGLHIAFWLVYLLQDLVLIITWIGPFLKGFTGSQLTIAASADAFTMLLPKMLLSYYLMYRAIPLLIREGNNQFKAIGEIILVTVMSILLYRGMVKYFVNPVIFKSSLKDVPFFDPRNVLMAFMDLGCVAGLAAFIKFSRMQLAFKEREKILTRQQLETELKFLRNQTNPHFLFNTLNNIYGLARKKSDLAPEAILKLSKLLRFMLYESGNNQIRIEDEIRMLETYIDLEELRYSELLTIRFRKELDNTNEMISPLILLPFVENAFKHGVSQNRFNAFININLHLHNGKLLFEVINSKEQTRSAALVENIGLSNVKRQLELLYKDYQLEVTDNTDSFSITLQLNLHSHAKY